MAVLLNRTIDVRVVHKMNFIVTDFIEVVKFPVV